MAQAIERLLATPKTTAVRPRKSSNMMAVSKSAVSKSKEEKEYQHPCSCGVLLVWGRSRPLYSNKMLLCGGSRGLLRRDRPTRASERNRIHGSDDGKPCR